MSHLIKFENVSKKWLHPGPVYPPARGLLLGSCRPRAQGGGVGGPVHCGGLVVLIQGLVPVVSRYENADKGDDDQQRYSHYGYHP